MLYSASDCPEADYDEDEKGDEIATGEGTKEPKDHAEEDGDDETKEGQQDS
jgi:hypothetical protein